MSDNWQPETPEQTKYLDHVAHCNRCKISGPKGHETTQLCAVGEELEHAAVFSAIGKR